MIDNTGRSIDYLRISITDRCNLRCVYCMPEDGMPNLTHTDILRYEEFLRLVRVMTGLGVRHVRVTGGEPMARRGCLDFIRELHSIPGIETISMTTNALLLDGRVDEAADAGLDALNISMDTLHPQRFAAMTRGGDVTRVLRVIRDALRRGLRVKINAVPVRGMNDGDLVDLARLAQHDPVHVRFIELMPVGFGAKLEPIPSDEVLSQLRAAFGELTPDTEKHGFGPARYVKPQGFAGSLGVISPMSHEFCDACNRVRLTSEGYLKLCLNHTAGADLRAMLRSGCGDEELTRTIRDAIAHKPNRHGFDTVVDDRENKAMNEIGG